MHGLRAMWSTRETTPNPDPVNPVSEPMWRAPLSKVQKSILLKTKISDAHVTTKAKRFQPVEMFQPLKLQYNGITDPSGPAGPPNVNFEGRHAILRAIGPRARLILTPAHHARRLFAQ